MTRHLMKIPLGIKPMVAKLVREPFHKPGWVYEEKYDGDRILAYKEGDQVRLLSRKAIDRKEGFPHIHRDPQSASRNLTPGRRDGGV